MSEEFLCRTCALPASSLLPLFAVPERDNRYMLILQVTTGLEIRLNDGLPQNICSKCNDRVGDILEFRQMCREAQAKFLQGGFRVKPAVVCVDTIGENDAEIWGGRLSGNFSPVYEEYKKQVKCVAEIDNKRTLDDPETDKDNIHKQEWIHNESSHGIDNLIEKSDMDSLDSIIIKRRSYKRDNHKTYEWEHRSSNTLKILADAEKKSPRKYHKKDKTKNNIEKVPLHLLWKLKPPKSKMVMDKYLDRSAPLYTCIICRKIYKKTGSFVDHTLVHTGFEFMCEHCGKVFRSSAKLLRHQRSLHGVARDSRLQCPHCHVRALDKVRLEEHRRTHTGERPYICDACGAGFTGRELLIQHLTVHITERNVQCEQCPARFRTRKCLNTHRSKRHKPRTCQWQCPYCHNTYRVLGNCKSHIKSVHTTVDVAERRSCVKIPL